MKVNRNKSKNGIYRLMWAFIVLFTGYLLIRLVTLSFSDNKEQVSGNISTYLSENICNKVFISGSSFVSYNMKNRTNKYSFPISIMNKGLTVGYFTKEDTVSPVLLHASPQDNISRFNQNEIIINNQTDTYGIGFNNNIVKNLPKEYILTNGVSFAKDVLKTTPKNVNNNLYDDDSTEQLPIGIIVGDFFNEETNDISLNEELAVDTMQTNNGISFTMEQLKDVSFLIRNLYIVDSTTRITDKLFDAEVLLSKDMSISQENKKPQILIYHTHSQEIFVDSRKNKESDTVVGMGAYFAKILKEEYGYNVIHDKSCYDVVDGKLDRNKAYNFARAGVENILEDNPSIEVIIDIHTDGMPKRSTIINGKETAQIMLFNGLSRDQNGPITRLDNPNLQGNLAFSLQLHMKSLELYPGLFYKNYLKCYRYNLHFRPKSLLIELGTYKNTIQSAKNALHPFAKVLDEVLQGK